MDTVRGLGFGFRVQGLSGLDTESKCTRVLLKDFTELAAKVSSPAKTEARPRSRQPQGSKYLIIIHSSEF